MGYTTNFTGSFKITGVMSAAQVAYIKAFSGSRRMKRDAVLMLMMPDVVREAVGLPIGIDGEYYVGAAEYDFGQARDSSVIDGNKPPAGCPGLWCQWVVNDLGTELMWDGGEKFYNYVAWLVYLIEHFFVKWGLVLNGTVEWQGEERGDRGMIVIENNVVIKKAGLVKSRSSTFIRDAAVAVLDMWYDIGGENPPSVEALEKALRPYFPQSPK